MRTTLARLVARPRLKSLVFAAAASAVAFVVLEIAWRSFLAVSGRGFFDDPREFTSPFFTTFQEPAPFVSGTELSSATARCCATKTRTKSGLFVSVGRRL